MTAITVRLSEKEKAALEKYGKISDVVRDAIQLYLDNKKKRQAIKKLEGLQKRNNLEVTAEQIVASIREDRDSNH